MKIKRSGTEIKGRDDITTTARVGQSCQLDTEINESFSKYSGPVNPIGEEETGSSHGFSFLQLMKRTQILGD